MHYELIAIKKINAIKKLTHTYVNSMKQKFQYAIELRLFDDRIPVIFN